MKFSMASFAMMVIALIAMFCLSNTVVNAAKGNFEIVTDIRISNVQHNIYLDTNFEYHIDKITMINTGKAPIKSFVHVIHSSKADHVSYVRASNPEDKTALYHAIRFNPDATKYPQFPPQYRYYNIIFDTPIQPSTKFNFEINTGFHNTFTPFPATIKQQEQQKMNYHGYTNFFSAYHIDTTQPYVYLASSSVENYSPRRAVEKENSGKKLKFPIITTTDESAVFELGEELTVHATNNSPFYHFKTAKRYFDVSTSGNIHVEENYDIKHVGAALKGSFHRYLHERATYRGQISSGPEINKLAMRLPYTAENIEFRDFNGNISTSAVAKNRQQDITQLNLELRYPLYGGWKSDFEINYDYKNNDVTSSNVDPSTGKVTLAVNFGYPFLDGNGDFVELRVLLPEGAEDITWTTPFDIDSITTSTIVSYKDIIGRTAVTFRSKNITPNMWEAVHISYKLPKSSGFAALEVPRVAWLIALFLSIVLFFTFVDVGLGSYEVTTTGQSIVDQQFIVKVKSSDEQQTADTAAIAIVADITTPTTPSQKDDDIVDNNDKKKKNVKITEDVQEQVIPSTAQNKAVSDEQGAGANKRGKKSTTKK